jgi:hypothetical protein
MTETEGELVLTPPEPVAAVPPERAGALIPLEEATRASLAERAATYVDKLARLDHRSPEFMKKIGEQSAEIQRIAAEPAVGVETLRKSFDQIYRTIDSIDTYKAQAVTSMQATVDALTEELGRASAYLERSHGRGELAP